MKSVNNADRADIPRREETVSNFEVGPDFLFGVELIARAVVGKHCLRVNERIEQLASLE